MKLGPWSKLIIYPGLLVVYVKLINNLIQFYQRINLIDKSYLFAFDEYEHTYYYTSYLWALILLGVFALGVVALQIYKEAKKPI